MLQEFKRMPEPLQKQTLIRIGASLLFLAVLAVVAAVMRDVYLCLPLSGAFIFYAASAFLLFRTAVLGEYVVIRGECSETVFTALKRRAKYFMLKTDDRTVKVMLRNRRRIIPAGTAVDLYVAKNSPVYEQNGTQMLYTYLAIEVK